VAVTSTARDAAHLSNPVGLARETVTALGMEESMTDTEDVRGTWCAGVTTVRSLELTTTPRTTAVTCHRTCPRPQLQ